MRSIHAAVVVVGFVVIARIIGHRTLALATAWKPYLEELLRAAPC